MNESNMNQEFGGKGRWKDGKMEMMEILGERGRGSLVEKLR